MSLPDESVNISFSLSGRVQDKPANVISVVVKNEDGDPEGFLEKWSANAWVYADSDVLEDLN